MKIANFNLGLSITIKEELIKQLRFYAKAYYPKEFGGLLIGRYSENKINLFITDTVLPTKFSSYRYGFGRETEDLRETIYDYFEQVPSKVYVGEWHTHPDGPCVPSITDIKALKEIVQHKEVFIDNPVLLIIRVTKQVLDLCFYVYLNNKVYRYEISSE